MYNTYCILIWKTSINDRLWESHVEICCVIKQVHSLSARRHFRSGRYQLILLNHRFFFGCTNNLNDILFGVRNEKIFDILFVFQFFVQFQLFCRWPVAVEKQFGLHAIFGFGFDVIKTNYCGCVGVGLVDFIFFRVARFQTFNPNAADMCKTPIFSSKKIILKILNSLSKA